MNRPYMQKSGEEIRDRIDEHWDDFWHLGLIAYEMQFRRKLFARTENEDRRAALIERGTPQTLGRPFPIGKKISSI